MGDGSRVESESSSKDPRRAAIAEVRLQFRGTGVRTLDISTWNLVLRFAHLFCFIKRVVADGCTDLPAQMSFYFVLSLVPFFLVLASFVGWLPTTSLWEQPVRWITTYLPQASCRVIFTFLDLTHEYTTFLSIGLLAMDVEAFRSLIQQKPDQPFCMKAIRESVDALQKTQMFSKVQVSIKPEQAGLNILFILEPASYIGVLDFPGATKTFTYTQLLQAVNIPEQTAYVDELPAQGTQALLQFFQTNGYFEATVNPVVQRDDAHRIVNLRFDCHLNRLARFGEFNIQGLSDEETTHLRESLKSFWATVRGASLKPGKKYSQQRITKSVSYIRSHLRKEGRLAPRVQFDSPTYRTGSGRADLNFQVDAGPLLSVSVMGARMFKRTIQRLVPIYEENSVDQDLVDEGRRNLLSYFESKGYFDATVDAHMDRQSDSVSVVYQVNRGAKHQVEGVNFQGNHQFEDKQLLAFVPVKKGRSVFGHFFSRGKFSEDLIRKSVNAIAAAYKNAGFV